METFDTIVLGGGGMRCIATLGALQYLYDNNMCMPRKCIGTSAGAMICFLVAVGFTPVEIMVQLCKRDVLESLLPLNFVSLVTGRGAIPYGRLEQSLEAMVREKCEPGITLEALYREKGRELVCTTFNLTDNRCEYLSWKTHPALPCLTAVRMSAALPILFDDCVVDGKTYIDGGVADNFPIVQCELETDRVFGCVLFTQYSALSAQNRLLALLRVVLSVSCNFYIERLLVTYEQRCALLRISIQDADVIEFGTSHPSKLELFSHGYTTCKTFFNSRSPNK